MIQDTDNLQSGFDLNYDIAIIGAGAAGITIAKELMSTNKKVCLLESGSSQFEMAAFELNDGFSVGNKYNVQISRQRFFGGSTNHWTGMCSPMDSIDFEKKEWVPYSGWPISKADLDPYYERAQTFCDLWDYVYDDRLWKRVDETVVALNPENAEPHFWQMSTPTRFGPKYREELEASSQVDILLHANVVGLNVNQLGSQIESIDVKTVKGTEGTLKAKNFVLACGGLENPRILLNSDRILKQGVANSSGFVGRCFMEHPHIVVGEIISTNTDEILNKYAIKKNVTPGQWAAIKLSAKKISNEKALNGIATFVGSGAELPKGIMGVKQLLDWMRPTGKKPDDLPEVLWNILSELDEVVPATINKLRGKQLIEYPGITVDAISEQSPNPDSRITLSDEKDALGQRKIVLDWQLQDIDKHALKVLTESIAMEVGRLEWGRLKVADWLLDGGDEWPQDLLWRGNHHMGTTRMSEDPKVGVVDANCKSHDIDNLFIAGSSVFTTCGAANPTLTIVALAIRLADHMKARLS